MLTPTTHLPVMQLYISGLSYDPLKGRLPHLAPHVGVELETYGYGVELPANACPCLQYQWGKARGCEEHVQRVNMCIGRARGWGEFVEGGNVRMGGVSGRREHKGGGNTCTKETRG